MSPRPDVSAARTEQIITAAMAEFSRRGFSAARMEDIAAAAGVSKGTLYLYFDSKDGIILSILENFISREVDSARKVASEEDTVTARLLSLARVMAADLVEMEPFAALYLEFLALAGRRESVRSAIQEFFQDFMDILVPLIQEGIRSGELRPVDPQEAALAISALFEGMILLKVYAPGMIDLEKHLTSGLTIELQGLRAHGNRG